MLCSVYLDLGIDDAAQTVDDGRDLLRRHMRIANKSCVTLQTVRVGPDIVVNRLASGLLLSLDQHTHIDG